MAKRFADTKLTREAWYRKMPPIYKAAWRYLADECDEVGVWPIDEDSMQFHVGAPVRLAEFLQHANDGKQRIARWNGKLVVLGFIDFQYGQLSEATQCKPHLKYIQLLRKHTLWIPYTKGFQTLMEEEKEMEQEKELEMEEEKASVHSPASNASQGPSAAQHKVTPENLAQCKAEWKKTLVHFEIDRALGERDEFALAAAIRQSSADWVRLALIGARQQKAGPRFDPKQFVSLAIYLHKDRIERLVNIGAGKESADGVDWAKVFQK